MLLEKVFFLKNILSFWINQSMREFEKELGKFPLEMLGSRNIVGFTKKLFHLSWNLLFKFCVRNIFLDKIKKIDAHKNGIITTEKYLKLQEFWCISWPPENSGSREILISSFRHFGSKFRESFTKVRWNFVMHFGSQP